jgi:two-component system CheB/CheR fusion protein
MEPNDKHARPPLELVANYLNAAPKSTNALVVIVVSPSGTDALQAFFKTLPGNVRTSFVVLSSGPGSGQRLEDLVLDVPHLEAAVLKGRERLKPAHVYLVPPGKHIQIRDQGIQIVAPASLDASQLPICTTLRSLAEWPGVHPIALLFSDHYSDGLIGLKDIRSAGGLIVQVAGRPIEEDNVLGLHVRSLVDAMVSPQQMATLLSGYLKYAVPTGTSRPTLWRDDEEAQLLEQIFDLLEKQYGVNFGAYTPAYLEAHFASRMRIHQTTSLSQYFGILKAHPSEAGFLAKRLLFRNTSFSKPNRIFQRVKETLLHRILEAASANGTCRIWVPECGSGEEAVMLAILLHERASKLQATIKIQIVATDSDTETLAFARRGCYALSIASQLPAVYLDRYFRREGDRYLVDEELQRSIHFFSHNTLLMPPLNGLHAIFCSELLSRLSDAVLSEVLGQFDEALVPSGFLIVDHASDHAPDLAGFVALNGSPYLFQKRPRSPLFGATTSPAEAQRPAEADVLDLSEEVVEIEVDAAELFPAEPADVPAATLLPEPADAPEAALPPQPSLLVDAEGRIVEQYGAVNDYLELPGDSLRIDLIDLVIPDIRTDLKAALEQAIQRNKTFKSRAIPFEINGATRPVLLQIRPVPMPDGTTIGAHITFIDAGSGEKERTDMDSNKSVTSALESMENDLAQLKIRLHGMLQDIQKSRDTLRDENRSLEGQGDMLRRQIAELEARNVELTDTNKELLALNRDLVKKVEEMRRGLQQASKKPEVVVPSPLPEPELLLKTPIGGLLSKRHEIRTALTSIIGFADLLADRLRDEDRELAKYVGTGGKQLSEALSVLLNQEEGTPASPIKEREVKLTPTKTARVLVVDDSDETRRLLALVLSDKFDCELAATASEAIEKARQESFTAVLLDINLGKDASGVDVLHHLRALQHYQNVPFMAVTAMATPKDRALLLREGFDAYLPKPFHKTALLTTLEQILQQKSMN